MSAPNECKQCDEFDSETKRLIGLVMSQEEIYLIALLLAASIKIQHTQMRNMQEVKKRMICKQQMDFAGASAGKLIIGLEPEMREKLLDRVFKDHGVKLAIHHGPCPHDGLNSEAVPS